MYIDPKYSQKARPHLLEGEEVIWARYLLRKQEYQLVLFTCLGMLAFDWFILHFQMFNPTKIAVGTILFFCLMAMFFLKDMGKIQYVTNQRIFQTQFGNLLQEHAKAEIEKITCHSIAGSTEGILDVKLKNSPHRESLKDNPKIPEELKEVDFRIFNVANAETVHAEIMNAMKLLPLKEESA